MEKSYRIHTNIASDTVLNVNMQQDFEFLEVLSLKIRQADAYKLHSSNYGVIVGRVLANDAFGVPNAKISVFIERDDNDSTELENIYPYTSVRTKDKNDIRYNLLPDYSDEKCYRVVGTFPNKCLLLDEDTQVEIYDKYWKYTTVTNNAGDYMIFGVPTGSQNVHVDVDLSDIGILSQKPRDMIYKGDNETLFDSSEQFKTSTNLDDLRQILSQDKSVHVYPFWGDNDNGIAAITRNDIQINYKFEPTCVFMGSIISDNDSNSIGHDCRPSEENGMNDQLVSGNGTIEMIRKTVDGLVEEYPIKGTQLIDENGVWCYQIPMNLDYIGTDEYGNVVATENASKGIPTRAQVRFRISKTETGNEGYSRHTAKYLVPMNPPLDEKKFEPSSLESGAEVEKMYKFGSDTPESCFRDLYWNNVYSVKNFVPKIQRARRSYSADYSALKGSNLATDQTEIPFNKLRVDMPFSYMLICILVTIVMAIIYFINATVICLINTLLINPIHKFKEALEDIWLVGPAIASLVYAPPYIQCISLSAGLTEGNVAYFPGCFCKNQSSSVTPCPDDMPNCIPSTDTAEFMDKVQRNLAEEYKIVKLDFYQDWLNGSLYMPLWYWRKRKKKTFLFGLFSIPARNDFCSCNTIYSRLKSKFACSIHYGNTSLSVNDDINHEKWHKSAHASTSIYFPRGIVNPVKNKDGLTAYYYAAIQVSGAERNSERLLENIESGFKFVRLYATDIILLGNLNENNIYGIPQFYKCLPSTTANIPPIGTIQESAEGDNDGGEIEYDTNNSEDTGITTTTGMDWGHTGDEQSPLFKDGLFMDLSCTSVITRIKACINVERLSELGSNLDSQYTVQNPQGNQLVSQSFAIDGFINKLELDDMEYRAMFATLNHVGFMPQSYQDEHNLYKTQIKDENTSYLVNKFKYIYPVNYDGRLQNAMNAWRNGFYQALTDVADEAYITFRLGAEKNGNKGRQRHFYSAYRDPLYNNSYYFYFGVNKGKTAIDKLNEMFNAECVNNDTSPFTIDITSQRAVCCPSLYNDGNKAYGWIKIISDDIQAPYTYTLYDSNNFEIVQEEGMTVNYFVIGGYCKSKSDNVQVNEHGYVRYQTVDQCVTDSDGKPLVLTNQEYTLELTDSNGKTLSEKIMLQSETLNVEFNVSSLGTKFYNTNESKFSQICNGKTLNNGIITISSVTVDGYSCKIRNVAKNGKMSHENGIYSFQAICYNDDGIFKTDIPIDIEFKRLSSLSNDSNDTVFECLCDNENRYRDGNATDFENIKRDWSLSFNNGVISMYVYQPSTLQVIATISLVDCTENCESNKMYSTITVNNGADFLVKLNNMPVRFMLGTSNDNKDASVSNTSYFYSSNGITNANSERICGWYGVNDETAYRFPKVNSTNQLMWKSCLSLPSTDITDLECEKAVLAYKFNRMWELSTMVFSTSSSDTTIRIQATGGVNPTLYRLVALDYANAKNIMKGSYILSDGQSVNLDNEYPMIVGNNYSGATETNTTQFNPLVFNNNCYLGAYFAAFDRNGGYTAKNTVNTNIVIKKIPSYAAVTPTTNSSVKTLGKDVTGYITNFGKVYQKVNDSQPYLRVLTVDRGISYSLTILTPVRIDDGMKINKYSLDDATDNDNVIKKSRVQGQIIGGIEMAYDENYNVISANTNVNDSGTTTSVTPSSRLEYSYELTVGDRNGQVKTIYNSRNVSTNYVWNASNIGYDAAEDVPTSPLIKQFYTAQIGDADVRNFFWSTFNKERLYKYSAKHANLLDKDNYYVWRYPYARTNLYNGDFTPFDENHNFSPSLLNANYPSKRFIDISGIGGDSNFEFNIGACSYNMTCQTTTDVLNASATEGEYESFSLAYDSPIVITDVTDYNNQMSFSYNGMSDSDVILSCKELSLAFKFASYSAGDFEIISFCPVLIKVLPETNGIDGISYYKTFKPASTSTQDAGWSSESSLAAAVQKVAVYCFNNSATVFGPSNIIPRASKEQMIYSILYDADNNRPLRNRDDAFSQIYFAKKFNEDELNGTKMFSIGFLKECINYNSLRNKDCRVFTASSPYDMRDIKITIIYDETYVIKTSSGFEQYIKMRVKYRNDGSNTDNQIFSKTDNQYGDNFSFVGESFGVVPTITSGSTSNYDYVDFSFKWNSSEHKMFGEHAFNHCDFLLYVICSNNFGYKITLGLVCQDSRKPEKINEKVYSNLLITS